MGLGDAVWGAGVGLNAVKGLAGLAVTAGESLATMFGHDFVQDTVDTLLSTMDKHPTIHVGIVVVSGASQYGRKNGQPDFLSAALGRHDLLASMGVSASQTDDRVENMFMAMLDPNIEGIPILTTSLQRSGDTEVARSSLLSASGGSRSIRMDNAVPQPMTWSLDGYIQSLSALIDAGMVIKSTLALQIKVLDAYRKSRKPVMFKDNMMRFYKVLLTHVEYTDTPENQNTIHVRINMVEYCPLEVQTTNAATLIATLGSLL